MDKINCLVEKLGVLRQAVNAIETGRCEASLSLAFAITALFSRAS